MAGIPGWASARCGVLPAVVLRALWISSLVLGYLPLPSFFYLFQGAEILLERSYKGKVVAQGLGLTSR